MRVLLVDDSPRTLSELSTMLAAAGFEVRTAGSAAEALAAMRAEAPDLLLADHLMPGASGLDLLVEVRAGFPQVPVVLMNDLPTVAGVVLAMQAGASGYVQKPVDRGILQDALARALAPRPLPGPLPAPSHRPLEPDPVPSLVGVSACIRNVKELIRAAARTSSPVFLYGPSGTGKEMIAEAIHVLSPRAQGPFVPVNCGALPEGLAESELFGAEKGAYTGADGPREGLVRAASGGTLFLDELGEMPLPLQVKLLRVVQKRAVRTVGGTLEEPVDVRVIAATNRPPQEAIRERLLREDLYYRLAVVKINMEPLARRPEDIQPLCETMLARLRTRYGEGPRHLAPAALAAMQRYDWPGNVRELENVLDLVFAVGNAEERIELEDLPEGFGELVPEGAAAVPPLPPVGYAPEGGAVVTLREAEMVLIKRAMLQARGNKAKAARMLGISRPYLYRRLSELEGESPQGSKTT